MDAFSTTAIGLGIGLSPFVEMELALAGVILYLALCINVYLETTVFGVFQLAYSRLGPTEVRILLIALLGTRLVRNLVHLSRLEPLPHRRPG